MHARHNNFDALRFWAALVVLWSHAFPIAYGSETHEPLYALSRGQSTFGGVAVSLFFVISGYLITRSFEHSETSWAFARARLLRIVPALLVVLAMTAFILGPIVSDRAVSEYFASSAPYRYVLAQASFTRHLDQLPGVFASNPHPYVNASLWTLRYEVACYVLVFALGVTRLLTRHVTLALYVAAIAYLEVVGHLYPHLIDDLPGPDRLLDLGAKFLAGALLYQWRVALRARWAWLSLAVLGGTLLLGEFRSAERTALPYLVIFLAIGTTHRLPALTHFGDLSYGTYIYAWPVSQCVVLALPEPSWIGVGLIATPIVLGLALASWHLMEKRALAWKAAPTSERSERSEREPAFSAWEREAR